MSFQKRIDDHKHAFCALVHTPRLNHVFIPESRYTRTIFPAFRSGCPMGSRDSPSSLRLFRVPEIQRKPRPTIRPSGAYFLMAEHLPPNGRTPPCRTRSNPRSERVG